MRWAPDNYYRKLAPGAREDHALRYSGSNHFYGHLGGTSIAHQSIVMTQMEFGSAYQASFRQTVKFLLSKGAPMDSAEDLAQAAWSKGWEHLIQLRNQDQLTTWVNTIAFNLYRRAIRDRRRLETLMDMSGGKNINVAAIDVSLLLKLCSPAERSLLLHQMHGLTTSEIAHRVGVTEAAVRVRLTRARQSARMLLREPRYAEAA